LWLVVFTFTFGAGVFHDFVSAFEGLDGFGRANGFAIAARGAEVAVNF
jgi:4-hydroxyphenylpyruvate dioxygenase-like putative hemolysin